MEVRPGNSSRSGSPDGGALSSRRDVRSCRIEAAGRTHDHVLICMVRPESWTRPAGESPVRVIAGAPGSRPRFVGESWRAERGVKSLFGGSKRAGRSVKRTLQPRQSHNGGAEPLMSRRRPLVRGLFRSRPGGSTRGMGGGTCAWSGRNRRDPSAWPASGKDQAYKPMVKSPGVQRESEGVVVPVIGVQHNAPGGKGPRL